MPDLSHPEGGVLITGVAGFIGSHLADALLAQGRSVIGVDNFVRGTRSNIAQALGAPRFTLVEADLSDAARLNAALAPVLERGAITMVWHLAANSDIRAGVADPQIDLRDTFMTTFNTLAMMRAHGTPSFAFASTSAIYGERADVLYEDSGPLLPISNYGAMKLASEALISAAAESWLNRAWIFRFPNVIGRRGTHGVIYDLLEKLAGRPEALEVLGDGSQCKPYMHVAELIEAMSFIVANGHDKINVYNIGPVDEGATVRFIAEEVVRRARAEIPLAFTGGTRGWVGDVPRFRYSIDKLRRKGWAPTLDSEAAVRRAVAELVPELLPPDLLPPELLFPEPLPLEPLP